MKQFTLLFLKRDDALLLAMKKRGFGAGKWNGVGGKLETGETIEEAAVRECQEEIMVTPKTFELMAIHDFLFPNGDELQVHAFLCDAWEGEPRETEEMRPQWFPINEIPYSTMWQDDIMWLPFVLSGKHVRCRFTFDQEDNLCAAELEMVSLLRGQA